MIGNDNGICDTSCTYFYITLKILWDSLEVLVLEVPRVSWWLFFSLPDWPGVPMHCQLEAQRSDISWQSHFMIRYRSLGEANVNKLCMKTCWANLTNVQSCTMIKIYQITFCHISEKCNTISDYHFAANFCTCRDSYAVVACAKFCNDHFIIFWMRAKHIFQVSLILNYDGMNY